MDTVCSTRLTKLFLEFSKRSDNVSTGCPTGGSKENLTKLLLSDVVVDNYDKKVFVDNNKLFLDKNFFSTEDFCKVKEEVSTALTSFTDVNLASYTELFSSLKRPDFDGTMRTNEMLSKTKAFAFMNKTAELSELSNLDLFLVSMSFWNRFGVYVDSVPSGTPVKLDSMPAELLADFQVVKNDAFMFTHLAMIREVIGIEKVVHHNMDEHIDLISKINDYFQK